ncbi:MAG: tRNA (guanine(10)-N(2))-dimethyltransferase [Candidatus Hadarchaeia archaeon]
METEIVREGRVELEVPKLENYRTSQKEYVPSKTPVFFNPVMELSRDLSVSSLQIYEEEIDGLRICDLLAGVGARGIRYAKELKSVSKVVINDRSEKATEFIRKNKKINNLKSVEVREEDGNSLISGYRPRFHVIDIDPFGSPIPFIDSALTAISRRGLLLASATDTAPLCGNHPRPCKRRYGAKPLRTPYSRELGVRIFIGAIQRRAAAYDLAFKPVLTHATQHYFRSHLKVSQGAKKADKVLKNQGYISHCFSCGRRKWKNGISTPLDEKCECGKEFHNSGPLWLGSLSDRNHIKNAIIKTRENDFELSSEEIRLLELTKKETDGPPTFHEVHKLSSRAGVSPPKLDKTLRDIRKKGFFASRTYFSDTGIRTDAPMEVLLEVIS